jgi:transcriptional regulator with XRE-family HTH domain
MSSKISHIVNFNLGERLRQFAKQYGGISKLAAALGISQPRLSNYLSGTREISIEIMNKLSDLGCDTNWLMTGLDRDETNKKFSEMVSRISKQELTKGEMEIIAILRTLEIAEPIDFHVYFDYALAVQDKIKKGTEKSWKYKMVAEPQVKYSITKKGRNKK